MAGADRQIARALRDPIRSRHLPQKARLRAPQTTSRKRGICPSRFTVEDISTIHVAKNAIDRFRHHHGGNRPEAEVQLRCMLEDFLLKSARSVSSGKRLKLPREGYAIFLSPTGDTVTSYSTVHRERTWEQVKSGVKSRFESPMPERLRAHLRREAGEVDLSAFGTTFRPAICTPHLPNSNVLREKGRAARGSG